MMLSSFHIVVAMKPLDGNFSQNAVEHGVAGINIDGCRVSGVVRINPLVRNAKGFGSDGLCQGSTGKGVVSEGRFPANLILQHSEGCKKVGTKKVESTSRWTHQIPKGGGRIELGLKNMEDEGNILADSDGKETVDAWECVETCPTRLFPETLGSGARLGQNKENLLIDAYGGGWKFTGQETDRSKPGSASRFFKQVKSC